MKRLCRYFITEKFNWSIRYIRVSLRNEYILSEDDIAVFSHFSGIITHCKLYYLHWQNRKQEILDLINEEKYLVHIFIFYSKIIDWEKISYFSAIWCCNSEWSECWTTTKVLELPRYNFTINTSSFLHFITQYYSKYVESRRLILIYLHVYQIEYSPIVSHSRLIMLHFPYISRIPEFLWSTTW